MGSCIFQDVLMSIKEAPDLCTLIEIQNSDLEGGRGEFRWQLKLQIWKTCARINSLPHGVIDFLRFRNVPWACARFVNFSETQGFGRKAAKGSFKGS